MWGKGLGLRAWGLGLQDWDLGCSLVGSGFQVKSLHAITMSSEWGRATLEASEAP